MFSEMNNRKSSQAFYVALSDITGLPREKLVDNMSLYPGLGIAGSDGWQLIDKLNAAYSIDWVHFDPYGFFGNEVAFNPFSFLRDWFTGKCRRELEVSHKVTIGHLKKVCMLGKWFDPE
jgi:hypothetical protein